jgi:hypothetical protein
MSCTKQKNTACNLGCQFNVKNSGIDDVTSITINGADRTQLNWSQISIPEVLRIPAQKPDIEQINQICADINFNCVKLIETPFAFEVFDRLATPLEITSVEAILDLVAALTIAPIIAAVNAILAIPGLPAIPAVAALQAALTAVETAFAAVTAAAADITAILADTCVLASVLVAALRVLLGAVQLLLVALNALIAAANALAAATAAIPIVGPLVAAAVTALLTAINVVVTAVNTIITAIQDLITMFAETQILVIIENAEGTCLSGRKLVVEGSIKQRVVYTALEPTQSVHSAHFEVPFSAFVIVYASFVGLVFTENVTVVTDPATCTTGVVSGFPFDPANPPVVNLCEEFTVTGLIEDIFSTPLDDRTIFKNITLFLWARPAAPCV